MTTPRACWCGHPELQPYSTEYDVCKTCGTLVSRAPVVPQIPSIEKDTGELYSKDYWLDRQREHHGLPDIHARSRLDLPERCIHWLEHLLKRRLPPARVLEVGSGHGGYVALLNWAGFTAIGIEMSPWVVEFARKIFGIDVVVGPIESQAFAAASFDIIVMNDVIEHLPDPLGTLTRAATLLAPGGFFMVQTPEYKEHLSHADLLSSQDLFLKHMENNNDEHLYLFSRRSVQEIFRRAGFSELAFSNPVYEYDMFFTASQRSLSNHSSEEISNSLSARPSGRLVQALLDKAYESNDRGWAIKRLETET